MDLPVTDKEKKIRESLKVVLSEKDADRKQELFADILDLFDNDNMRQYFKGRLTVAGKSQVALDWIASNIGTSKIDDL